MQRRFDRVRRDVWKLFVTDNSLGLTFNATKFVFETDPAKIRRFQKWLQQQINAGILEINPVTGEPKGLKPWMYKYIDSAYKKGLVSSYIAAHKKTLGMKQGFYEGTRDQFLTSAFARGERTSKLQLLYTRSYEDLKGVTSAMSTQMARVLTDGMAHGKHPLQTARLLSKTITGISKKRAKVIALTECMPGDSLVDNVIATAAHRRWYDGPMVEVKTGRGKKFSVTPNHPMLTQDGWVAAGQLNQSHNLIGRKRRQDSSPSGDPNINGRPATISQIFDALSTVGTFERHCTGKPDFHGDGIDGEVDIATADGALCIGRHSSISEHLAQLLFSPSGFSTSTFCPFCRSLLSINKQVCLCGGSSLNPMLFKASIDKALGNTKAFLDLLGRLPRIISCGNSFAVHVMAIPLSFIPQSIMQKLGLGIISSKTGFSQNTTNPSLIVPGSFADLPLCETGEMELDNVLSVSFREFSGHVFNLSTPFGYFTTNSLYTGNTIHAHAEGQLDGFEDLGIEEVGADVEFSTSDDDIVCPICEKLKEAVYTIDAARGVIPVHPRCRCSWLPVIKLPAGVKLSKPP